MFTSTVGKKCTDEQIVDCGDEGYNGHGWWCERTYHADDGSTILWGCKISPGIVYSPDPKDWCTGPGKVGVSTCYCNDKDLCNGFNGKDMLTSDSDSDWENDRKE